MIEHMERLHSVFDNPADDLATIDKILALLGYEEDRVDIREQLEVMLLALNIYAERNVSYQDNWRRSGWRGVLIRIRERVDRLWDVWWERQQRPTADPDDALDLINFAAFMVRAVGRGETTRDGEWWK